MTSPLKPWERASSSRVNSRSLYPNARVNNHIVGPRNKLFPRTGSVDPPRRRSTPMASGSSAEDERDSFNPPQVPPRPNQNSQRMGYRSLSSPMLGGYGNYSSYGMSGSPYSMYGSYGGGGYNSYSSFNRMGYGNYGNYGNSGNYGHGNVGAGSFVRRAEETSRPAFESVESIVQAFGSIATMLESTFFAVHSSFRAVLGVADQFSLMKQNIINTLGALTIFKTIRYIFRKLLILLRLRKPTSPEDEVWGEAKNALVPRHMKTTRSWPIVMFFAVVLGTPWLIWKFLQTVGEESSESSDSWLNGHGEHFVARAEFDFEAENEDELSFREGDTLRIAPKGKQPSVRGWILATVDGKQEGIVPTNHVKILGRRSGSTKKSTNKVRLQLINEEEEDGKNQEEEDRKNQEEQPQENTSELSDVFEDVAQETDTAVTATTLRTESNLDEKDK